MSYDVGTRVVVCSNDYVLQRVPHLVGQVGTIEVAPIHPSTWCTIAMDDGVTTVKLQPTAIRHLDDGATEDDSPASSIATPPRSTTPPPTKYNRPRAYSSPAAQAPSQSHRLVHGAKVTIIGTENVEQRVPQYIGMEGTIKEVPVHPATWYKIQFPDGRVVTFRPSALRLTSDLSSLPEDGFDFDEEAPPSKKKKPARGRSRTLSVGSNGSSRRLAAVDSENWTDCQVRIQSGKLAGQVASVKASGNGWVQLETPYGEVAKRASDLEILNRDTANGPLPGSPSLRRVRSFSESHITTPNHHSNVIVPAKLVSMKRDYVRKFIEKQQAMNRNRPELTYWLHSIRSASIDSTIETALARDTLNVCDTCQVELWPGANYCWNECCPASPVYYRLPGAAGTIPIHRCHVLNSRAISPDISELQEMSEACEILSSWRSPRCSVVNDYVCSAPTAVLESAPPLTAASQRKDSCVTDCEVTSNGSFSNTPSDDTSRVRIRPLNPNIPSSPRFKKFAEYPCSPPPSHEEFARIVSQHPVVPSSSLPKYNGNYSSGVTSVTSQLSKNKLTPVTNVANTSPLVMNETIPSIKELYNNTTHK